MANDASRRLGAWLVFCVVYADIGTSVFYVPGILYQSIGNLASLAQLLTLGVFVSIALKYVEISARCPDGGGVVSIAEQAFPERPSLALLGGAMITVDYFLTSAISGVSSIYYLASLFARPGPDGALVQSALAEPMTACVLACVCLALLLWLNVIGLKESATVTSALVMVKLFVCGLIVLFAGIKIAGTIGFGEFFRRIIEPEGVKLTAASILIGYSDTWLAYSGLESAAQISGAMAEPTRKTARRAMIGVICAIAFFSPLLTGMAVQVIPDQVKDTNSFISQLAMVVGGRPLQALTVIAATLLLVMACSTAIVGNYHVNTRLVTSGFLPPAIGTRNRRFGTPHVSIAISAIVPMLVILGTRGRVEKLGDLYAFCLLGTLTISSVSIDVLRWREHGGPFTFLTGSFVSAALALAWVIKIVHRPDVLPIGGGIVLAVLAVGFASRRGLFGGGRRVGAASLREVEDTGAACPEGLKVFSLNEAKGLRAVEGANVMVALRGVNESLLEEAALLARGRKEANVYIVYVDEVPGLFMPNDVTPSDEARRVLADASKILHDRFEILALPVWRLASDTAVALAEAAKELEVKTLMMGTTKRGAIWHLLRGNVMKGLLSRLPSETKLLIAS